MWGYIKSYASFCVTSLYKHRLFTSMKTIYALVAFIASVVLLWWNLKDIVRALPPIGKRWWAIIFLALVVALLLILIGFIKSFHERIVRKIYQADEGITEEFADCAERIEWLTLILGRGDALSSLLEADNAQPLSRLEIQLYESDVRTTLDRFGPNWAESHFEGFPASISESLSDQQRRMNVHRSRLHALIQAQRAHRQSIAAKANSQKQEVLATYRGAGRLVVSLDNDNS
jgi:hypothetical protein